MGGPVSTDPLWEDFHECSVATGPGAVVLLGRHRRASVVPELMDISTLRAMHCGIAGGTVFASIKLCPSRLKRSHSRIIQVVSISYWQQEPRHYRKALVFTLIRSIWRSGAKMSLALRPSVSRGSGPPPDFASSPRPRGTGNVPSRSPILASSDDKSVSRCAIKCTTSPSRWIRPWMRAQTIAACRPHQAR